MKALRFIVFALLCSILIASLFSCGQNSASTQNSKLLVGTNAEYPPFEYKEGEAFKGIDMELIQYIGSELNMEVKIVDMDFDSLIPSLVANKIDCAIAAMTITDERKNQVDFSIPYYIANQSIIVKKDSDLKINSVDDLLKLKIGAQNGTTGQIYIEEQFIKTKKMPVNMLQKYASNTEAITDLLNGNIDVVIIDDSVGIGYSKLKPVKPIFTINSNETYGIAFAKGSTLIEKFNKILTKYIKSKEWAALISNYQK